ncbi:CPBP family intramembrane metalloprotease [Fructobacillus sp. W13]|uniref:CPBP family intramembrane metalloprotease n=1 Tax=Fructobacillus apis TaxID=2935017 RepID=A0ABT0ZR28_9LACO|nr:CPBP family intramembrane glutamic endopeptidase [Fructobacillus apis]MCO0832446.1 CPBP family intramembrane metalloprotease [Fructobacillus apis]
MAKFREKNPNESHHGVGIFFLTVLGMFLYPGYPDDISLKWSIRLAALMCIVLFFLIRLVRRVTNQERLFDKRFGWTTDIKWMTGIIAAIYLMLYVTNGNIESVGKLSHGSANLIVSCLFTAIGAGFFEEYLMRGYFFNLFQRVWIRFGIKKNRLLYTSLVTSLMFGLFHLTNLGQGPTEAIIQQAFYAACFGLFFATLRILTNTVWAGAILHFLFDLQDSLTEDLTASPWWLIILIFLPVAVASLVIIHQFDGKVQNDSVQELEA